MKRTLFLPCFILLLLFTAAGTATADEGSGPRIRVKDGTSSNWSGYAVETNLASPQSNAVSDVKGQWTVPTVTGTTNAYSSAWIGIDGYSDGTVEQIGTEQDWSNGTPKYYAWFEMYPKFPVVIKNITVHPGDSISAEVKYNGNNFFVLSMTNLSSGQTYSTTRKARAQRQSAEWIVEAPSSSGGVLPLADFGTVTFTNAYATLNGQTGSISYSAWQKDAITMVSKSGSVKATPSGLSPDGTSFSVAWNGS